MTLYLKYRPQTLEELDLEAVRERLKKIVASRVIPHAFLFSGPKGVGKTSAARILAKVVNCEKPNPKTGEPCNSCDQCLSISKGTNIDVVEIDAASNRGIDDIRTLRENIALSPSRAKKKVYIIDEAHMLTLEAANAFLKTLEEPPEHVIFILATTDPHRLPETIRSRLININFAKAVPSEIKRQLKRVIRGEKLKVQKGVIPIIAKASDGSFRDAVKILETLSLGSKKVTRKTAEKFFIHPKSLNIEHILNYLSKHDSTSSLEQLEEYMGGGGVAKSYLDSLIERLRIALLSKESLKTEDLDGFNKNDILELLDLLIEARSKMGKSPVPELPLEMAIIKWCGSQEPKKDVDKKAKESPQTKKPEISSKNSKKTLDDGLWAKILSEVKIKNTTIEALLRAARPLDFDGNNLLVGVYYRFHKERLEIGENVLTLEGVATQILGSPVRIKYTLAEREKAPPEEPGLSNPPDDDIIQAAKEIFGN